MERKFKSTSMSFDAFERSTYTGKAPKGNGRKKRRAAKHKAAKHMNNVHGKN